MVPLLVRIGRIKSPTQRGHQYPDFDRMNVLKKLGDGRVPMKWQLYVSEVGGGIFYDNKCGWQRHEDGSPCRTWWCVMLVEADFAAEAVETFPDQCSIMGEEEFARFWNRRVMRDESEFELDAAAIAAARELRAAVAEGALDHLSDRDRDALLATARATTDPDSPASGIRRRQRRTWAAESARRGIAFADDIRAKRRPARSDIAGKLWNTPAE